MTASVVRIPCTEWGSQWGMLDGKNERQAEIKRVQVKENFT